MAKMSESAVPNILFTETANASIVTPAAGTAKLFRDTDNVLKWKDEAGTVTSIGSGIAETLIDAKGDLIAGSAADTAARLAVGSNGKVLTANSAQATGLEWVTPSSGTAKLYDYEVSGSDKASIDTFVDGTTVANFAGYDVLEWFVYARTDEAVVRSDLATILNNDTGNNYDRVYSNINNTTGNAGNSLAQASWSVLCPGSTANATKFAAYHFRMPNYLGTVGQKSAICQGGTAEATAANTDMFAVQFGWRNTAAVTRITVKPGTALKKLVIGSRLIVYGR